MNLQSLEASENQQLESKLRELLARSIQKNDLQEWADVIAKLAQELNISHLQCAAALASSSKKFQSFKAKSDHSASIISTDKFVDRPRMIRYRLEVGRKHNVSVDDIRQIVVNESGVDKKQIGPIQLHAIYSFIELPEGMPSDIYQHMKAVKINNQPLQIKIIRTGRRRGKSSFKRSGRRVNRVGKVTSASQS